MLSTVAPFASIAIRLDLGSTTGLRYTTKCCVECGHPLIERNNDKLLRISNSFPQEAKANSDGIIETTCHRCQQQYDIYISQTIKTAPSPIPLYKQPQTIFLTVTDSKKLRDCHCLECGKAYYSISDRYSSLSDNTIPLNLLNPDKLGPLEVWCDFQHCKQRWSIMA